jgi:laminin, beta 1
MKNWSSIIFILFALSFIKTNRLKNTRKNDEFVQLTAYKEKFSSNKNCTHACFPETGDLLIGRKNLLHTSSTCGEGKVERYCVIGHSNNDRPTQCDVCDSSQPYSRENRNSHRIENIVNDIPFSKDDEKWWQSENGKSHVQIQVDLLSEFIFTHFIMTFRTFRPAAMVVERSSDHGDTWRPYAYFAWNCRDAFPHVTRRAPKELGEVYCESRYSNPTPSKGGEVVFKAIPPDLLTNKNPYSKEIIDLLKITNLRINFTRIHTFGDTEIDDSREDLKDKYYYALSGMIIRGSCLCYGHASKCIADNEMNDYLLVDSIEQKNYIVHSKCACEHNTDGNNCEKCLPLYNDRPWSPANLTDSNSCAKCECNNHADSCNFNLNKYLASGNHSGGICVNCRHNTQGDNCDKCVENYWRDFKVDMKNYLACKRKIYLFG